MAETLITFDQFDDSAIDTSKWSYYNHASSTLNFNLSNGGYSYGGEDLFALWINGNKTGDVTNSTTLKTISFFNSTTNGYIQTDTKAVFGASLPATTAYLFGLGNYTAPGSNSWLSSSGVFCGVYIEWTSYNGFAVIEHTKSSGTTLYTIHANGAYTDDLHTIRINASRTINTTTFKVYYDNALIVTHIQNNTCPLYAMYSAFSNSNTEKEMIFDNFYMYSDLSTPAGSYPVGTFVGLGNGEMCLTGYIEYGRCALLPGGHTCSLSVDCISRSCQAGYCTQPTIIQNLEQSRNQQFGDTAAASDFVCLFLILGGAIGILVLGGFNVLTGGVAMAYILFTSIFFIIIGWLSLFFLFGVILLLVIGAVLLILLNSGG